MKINLKRALKLRRALEAQLKAFSLPTSVPLQVLSDAASDPSQVILMGREEMQKHIDQTAMLSVILFSVRSNIAKANVENNVEIFISRIADLDRLIAIEKAMSEITSFTPDSSTLEQEIEIAKRAINNPDARVYGRPDRTLNINLVTQAMRDSARVRLADLRRQREAADDARTAANAAVTIEIGDDHTQLLTELGLI